MTKLKWLSARLPEPDYLPTPSFGINRALGGEGLASGRIHVYWGPMASGKTTLGLHQIAEAQRQGKRCAFIDAEKTYSTEWAVRCGVNVDELKYISSNTAEDLLDLIIPDIESGYLDVIMLDSIQSVNFESFFKKNASSGGMGSYARSSKLITHKMLQAIQPHQQIIFVSHAAMDLSGTYPVMKAALGNAIQHWASTIIRIQKIGAKDSIREEDGAHRVKWKIEKSKQSEYPIEGEFYFTSTTATIDMVDEVVAAAKHEKLLTGTNWLSYIDSNGEEHKLNGATKLTAYLKENPEVLNDMKEKLNAIAVHSVGDEEEVE
jgi:recombination protein RecA